MENERIEILEDDNVKIVFEKIVTDVVNRAEVEVVEKRIAELEAQDAAIINELTALREKIAYAKEIIAKADAEKAKKLEEENIVVEEAPEAPVAE